MCYVHRKVPNHQPIPQQETVRADTNPTPNKREPEMLINCRMGTTLPQTHTLVKVSLSCTFLKTMKLWTRWSLRADVQQWDTYPEPTELRLICCLTGSTSVQRSKSNMSTLETNWQTCWPYAHSLATNGTIFSNCSKMWLSLCSSCIHPGDQRDDPLAMSMRQMQEKHRGRGELERVAAKSRLAWNLLALTPNL